MYLNVHPVTFYTQDRKIILYDEKKVTILFFFIFRRNWDM